MGQRTTKAERRAARRQFGPECRRWGTARCARLMRRCTEPLLLRLSLALEMPPEMLTAGYGPTWHGQYWPPTGAILDAPYHPRLPATAAQIMGPVMAELDASMLHPHMERIGAAEEYTVGFELTGATLGFIGIPGPPLHYRRPTRTLTIDWEPDLSESEARA
jgi:hypothetical protein